MKTQNCMDTIAIRTAPPRLALPPWLWRTLKTLQLWFERSRQRRHLASLNDHMLKDIGLDRTDVSIEIEKPFWRP